MRTTLIPSISKAWFADGFEPVEFDEDSKVVINSKSQTNPKQKINYLGILGVPPLISNPFGGSFSHLESIVKKINDG